MRKHMTIKEIVENIGPMSVDMTPKMWERVLIRVWVDGTKQDAARFLKNMFDYNVKRFKRVPKGTELPIFGTSKENDIVKATNRAAKTIAKVWKARKG